MANSPAQLYLYKDKQVKNLKVSDQCIWEHAFEFCNIAENRLVVTGKVYLKGRESVVPHATDFEEDLKKSFPDLQTGVLTFTGKPILSLRIED